MMASVKHLQVPGRIHPSHTSVWADGFSYRLRCRGSSVGAVALGASNAHRSPRGRSYGDLKSMIHCSPPAKVSDLHRRFRSDRLVVRGNPPVETTVRLGGGSSGGRGSDWGEGQFFSGIRRWREPRTTTTSALATNCPYRLVIRSRPAAFSPRQVLPESTENGGGLVGHQIRAITQTCAPSDPTLRSPAIIRNCHRRLDEFKRQGFRSCGSHRWGAVGSSSYRTPAGAATAIASSKTSSVVGDGSSLAWRNETPSGIGVGTSFSLPSMAGHAGHLGAIVKGSSH